MKLLIKNVEEIILFILIGLLVGILSHYFAEVVSILSSLLRGQIDYTKIGYVGNETAIKIVCALFILAVFVSVLILIFKIPRFHGPADVILASQDAKTPTDVRAGLLSGFVSFLSISGGAPVGQYGPLVHLSATFAAIVKKILFAKKLDRELLIGCSVAAAIASAFGAPIAGIVFSQEVILRNFSLKYFAPITISSSSSFIFTNYIFGNTSFLLFDAKVTLNPVLILIVILIGILGAIISLNYCRLLVFCNKFSGNLRIKGYVKPFLGATIISIIGMFIPQILGLSAETIDLIVQNKLELTVLIVVFFAKFLLTPISISLNLFGGIFSPALMLGLCFGGIIGIAVDYFVGLDSSLITLFAISGMGAVIAPTIGGPITAVLLILEMSENFSAATIGMMCIVVSSITFRAFSNSSFFEMQLVNRGFDIALGPQNFKLSRIIISEINRSDSCVLKKEMSNDQKIAEMHKGGYTEAYLIDDDNTFIQKVNIVNLLDPNAKVEGDDTCFEEKTTLLMAIDILQDFVGESIPIVDKNNCFIGAVTEGDIFSAFKNLTED